MLGRGDTINKWRELLPPATAARVYYAYKLIILPKGGGQAMQIGTFQSFNPRSTRQVIRNRGIANNAGIPHELIPGPADLSITVNYLALYSRALTQALGYGTLGSSIELNYMNVPFDIVEQCYFPPSQLNPAQDPQEATDSDVLEAIVYKDCYISDIGRTVQTGTVNIVETATIQAALTMLTSPVSMVGAPDDRVQIDRKLQSVQSFA